MPTSPEDIFHITTVDNVSDSHIYALWIKDGYICVSYEEMTSGGTDIVFAPAEEPKPEHEYDVKWVRATPDNIYTDWQERMYDWLISRDEPLSQTLASAMADDLKLE